MNLKNIQDHLVSQKWMMEKSQLLSFYDRIQHLKSGIYDSIIKKEFSASDVLPDTSTEDISDEGDICIININGILVKGASQEEQEILGLTNIDEISYALDEAANDPSINCIFCCFSSPGGETTGIIELGRKIKYIDENVKPIYAWTEKQMASAAAWLGSQAREIGMTESSQIGSCGVYMVVIDASEKYKQEGINLQTISSGTYKTMGHDDRPLKPDEKEILIKDVENQHQKFKDIIKSKRPYIKDEALEGLSYEGPAALENGWVDCICDSFEEYVQHCLE